MRLTTATSSGRRWDGSRSASRSWTRARQLATTKDKTSRLSNVRHLNRDRGDDADNKEADNDDGARLDDDSPAAATVVSSIILQLFFSWLHSSANDGEDSYGKKRQRRSSPGCKNFKFGYNDVDDGSGGSGYV